MSRQQLVHTAGIRVPGSDHKHCMASLALHTQQDRLPQKLKGMDQ